MPHMNALGKERGFAGRPHTLSQHGRILPMRSSCMRGGISSPSCRSIQSWCCLDKIYRGYNEGKKHALAKRSLDHSDVGGKLGKP
eukprot:456892-Rhodomonas_salina.1